MLCGIPIYARAAADAALFVLILQIDDARGNFLRCLKITCILAFLGILQHGYPYPEIRTAMRHILRGVSVVKIVGIKK